MEKDDVLQSGLIDGHFKAVYRAESAERTLAVGRLLSTFGLLLLGAFIVLDHVVLGFEGTLPFRLIGLVPLAAFLLASYTVLPRRSAWVLPMHAISLIGVAWSGCGIVFVVLASRPEVIGLGSGATGALFTTILGCFVFAAGLRAYLAAILLPPLVTMLALFSAFGILRPDEWLLFVDPGFTALIVILVAFRQERVARRELRSRLLAAARKEVVEQKLAELARSNEDLRRFAHVVSHDLKEPIRGVSALMGLIRERLEEAEGSDTDLLAHVSLAEGSAARMTRLIDALLTYTRVEARGQGFVPVDLAETLANVRVSLDVALSETDAELRVGPLPTVAADPAQMHQLFQNLLANGIKYAKPGSPPAIRVSTVAHEGEHEIRVRDEGIGIAEADHAAAFEIFRRLPDAAGTEGTGVGLAVCQRIVERHHGRLELESRRGEGATFKVFLPA